MKLHYFSFYGRAEPIRLLLNHSGKEFEDIMHTFDEWKEIKSNADLFEYGQMPVLEKDSKVYSNSMAILRYLGAEYGYYPTEAESMFQVNLIIDLSYDFCAPIFAALHIKDDDAK